MIAAPLPMSDPDPDQGPQPPNLYASPEFLDVVAKIYFPARRCCIEDFEVDGKLFRLLAVEGRGPLDHQVFLDIHEPLILPPAQSAPARKLRRLAGVSHGLVDLEEFRSSASWAGFDGAPTVLWSGFETWTAYVDLLRSRHRHNLVDDQRRRRRLQEVAGPLQFDADDMKEDVLPTCFQWKSMRDREAARTNWSRTDLFARRENREFFCEMRSGGLLRASTLRAGGGLLAIWLGAVYQGRWSGWVFAFNPDPSLSKFSLGRQLLYSMVEQSYRSGHKEFDFSIGLEPYKLFFATHVRATATLGTPTFRRQLVRLTKKVLGARHALRVRVRLLQNLLGSGQAAVKRG